MQLIKVRFLKNEVPQGRPYTYESEEIVKVGDIVQINSSAKGVVTDIGIQEEEVESFREKIKCIIGIAEGEEER